MRNAVLSSGVACCVWLLLVGCSSSSNPDGGPVQGCANCGTGLTCVQNADFPEGTCTAVCIAGGACPSGTACTPPLSTGNSYCLAVCGPSSPCSGNGVCTATSKGNLCLAPAGPTTLAASCPAMPQLLVGAKAGPPSDPGCRLPVVGSALQPADVQHLPGTYSPGDSVSFQVPQGAAGFSIVSQAVTTVNPFLDCGPGIGLVPNVPVPTPVLTPNRSVLFDITAAPPADESTALWLFFPVGGQQPYAQTLTFPNTTAGLELTLDGGLPGGQWSLTVNDFANEFSGPGGCDAGPLRNTYDVSVVVTPGPLPTSGQLSADVYLVTEQLDAGAALTNLAVQRFVKGYAAIYAEAGICLTTVTFHDVAQWAVLKYASLPSVDDTVTQDPCSDFRQMMTLAEPGRTMALFLVDELAPVNAMGDQIVGKDGAIPGMSTYNGTISGGAAVSIADLSSTAGCSGGVTPFCGPDRTALIAAHETGHFLGLYHPSEQTGDVFDPIADTAACVCALCETGAAATNCSDGGAATLVDDSVCSGSTQQCGGANLLMFWLLTASSRGQFSPQEAAVVRANPLISAP